LTGSQWSSDKREVAVVHPMVISQKLSKTDK